jgi:hypothetical protein
MTRKNIRVAVLKVSSYPKTINGYQQLWWNPTHLDLPDWSARKDRSILLLSDTFYRTLMTLIYL